jgi:hypothetical protein
MNSECCTLRRSTGLLVSITPRMYRVGESLHTNLSVDLTCAGAGPALDRNERRSHHSDHFEQRDSNLCHSGHELIFLFLVKNLAYNIHICITYHTL